MATKSAKKAMIKKSKISAVKKVAGKKATSATGIKKAAAKKATSATGKKKAIQKAPSGYEANEYGIFTPKGTSKPVPASKLCAGFKKAKKGINSIIVEIASTMSESYIISEIELSASFNADGKFMGFGIAGAATIKIKIKPEVQ